MFLVPLPSGQIPASLMTWFVPQRVSPLPVPHTTHDVVTSISISSGLGTRNCVKQSTCEPWRTPGWPHCHTTIDTWLLVNNNNSLQQLNSLKMIIAYQIILCWSINKLITHFSPLSLQFCLILATEIGQIKQNQLWLFTVSSFIKHVVLYSKSSNTLKIKCWHLWKSISKWWYFSWMVWLNAQMLHWSIFKKKWRIYFLDIIAWQLFSFLSI